jgi:hypothetical protein
MCSFILGLEGLIRPQDQPNRSMLTDDPHVEFSHDICFISFVNEKGGAQAVDPLGNDGDIVLIQLLTF